MVKFNIIGFGIQNYSIIPPEKFKHCPIDVGIRLVPKRNESGDYEPGMLFCVRCGYTYKIEDAAQEENFTPTSGPQSSKTAIITPKTKKKYYDKQGNLINDEQLLKDIGNGKVVLSYNEFKTEGDSKQPKRVVHRK